MFKLDNDEIYFYLKNNPDSSITDEKGQTFVWKDDQVYVKPLNHNNTNENLIKWREKLQQSNDYPVLKSLNNSWKILEDEYQVIKRDDLVAHSPLRALDYFFDLGFYPPPEVILAILDCYHQYLATKGKLSLEDVFFGKLERGVGNYSARVARNEIIRMLDFELTFSSLSKNKEKKSQYDIAEELIDRFQLNDDPDSLLRQYRRFKKKSKTDN